MAINNDLDEELKRTDIFASFINIIVSRKWLFLISFIGILGITIVAVSALSDTYESTTVINVQLPTMPNLRMPYSNEISQERNFIANQTEIIRSRQILEAVVNELNLLEFAKALSITGKIFKALFKITPDPMTKAIDDLRSEFKVELYRNTNMIAITATAKNAKGAAQVANTIARKYIDYTNKQMRDRIDKIYMYYQRIVEESHDDLLIAEENIRKFKANEPVTIVTEDSAIISQSINANLQRLEEIDDLVKKIKSGKDIPRDIIQGSGTANNMLDLRKDITNLYNEMQVQKQTTPETNDVAKNLSDLKAKVELKIDADSYLEELLLEKSYLEIKNRDLENRIKAISNSLLDLDSLNRILANKETIYNNAMSDLRDVNILNASETQEPAISVTEAAYEPLYPSLKQKVTFLLLGFVLSLVFACTACFISEYFDNSVRSIKEAEYLFRIPVFAAIPKIDKEYFE